MPFQKGQSGNPAGRRKGAKNRTTVAVKQALAAVYADLQAEEGDEANAHLLAWAKDNATEFYKLWVKMLPQEVNMTGAMEHTHGDAVDRPPRETREEWVERRAREMGAAAGAAGGGH